MIFARFMAIYGHKFKSCFETEDEIRIAKREWALSLSGFSEAQLVAAVDRCKETLAWMPSISEFLAIIDQLDGGDGVPTVWDAYVEACRYAGQPTTANWSHPVVYHAGKETEWFRLRTQEEREVFPVFRYHYGMVKRRFHSGEPLEEPSARALEDKRALTVCDVVKAFGDSNNISQEVAASLLYYLTKPEGSRSRANYRYKSQQKADDLGLNVKLPD